MKQLICTQKRTVITCEKKVTNKQSEQSIVYPVQNGLAKSMKKICQYLYEIFFLMNENHYFHLIKKIFFFSMIGFFNKPSIIIETKSLSLPYRRHNSYSF
jgi:hypothetical protein